MINFKGSQFEKEIILWGVRWYVAYPISYRGTVPIQLMFFSLD